MQRPGLPAASILQARCSARSCSAGSQIALDASGCSSLATVYLLATAATAFSWDFLSFALFRFLTGAGIGGEYTAIASTIQEFVPARYRGWTDLIINGSFWIGAALGAGGSIVLLDPALLPPDLGWRAAFFIGSVLGLFILVMRSWIPESPRWLMTHGRLEEAHNILDMIEDAHRRRGHHLPDEELATFRLRSRGSRLCARSGRRCFAPIESALSSASA